MSSSGPSIAGNARLVALSGSLPPGLPDDFYAWLLARSRAAGVPAGRWGDISSVYFNRDRPYQGHSGFSKIEAGRLDLEEGDVDVQRTVEDVLDLLAPRRTPRVWSLPPWSRRTCRLCWAAIPAGCWCCAAAEGPQGFDAIAQ
jgi:hypothetical protein